MNLAHLLTDTVTIVRRDESITDEYGDPKLGETSRTVVRGRLEQIGGQEATRNRQTVIADWRLFLMPDVQLDANDQVEVGAATFEVVSPPNLVTTPHSGPHHYEVLLQHVTG